MGEAIVSFRWSYTFEIKGEVKSLNVPDSNYHYEWSVSTSNGDLTIGYTERLPEAKRQMEDVMKSYQNSYEQKGL